MKRVKKKILEEEPELREKLGGAGSVVRMSLPTLTKTPVLLQRGDDSAPDRAIAEMENSMKIWRTVRTRSTLAQEGVE